MKFTAITLFPELIEHYCSGGLLGAARGKGLVHVECLNPRAFTTDVHHTVDDKSFGGGDGMVMKPEPLAAAVEQLRAAGPVRVAVMSPQGRPWSQIKAAAWAKDGGHVALVCGRYAGIDQRFVETCADEEISLGDFVLNGGELAALAVIESVSRLIPGVLGNAVSAAKDSFSGGLLEAPQFTRPREWNGLAVPSPLLSGHHAEISVFLKAVSLVRTSILRPDLITGDVFEAKARLNQLTDLELQALGLTRKSVSN